MLFVGLAWLYRYNRLGGLLSCVSFVYWENDNHVAQMHPSQMLEAQSLDSYLWGSNSSEHTALSQPTNKHKYNANHIPDTTDQLWVTLFQDQPRTSLKILNTFLAHNVLISVASVDGFHIILCLCELVSFDV